MRREYHPIPNAFLRFLLNRNWGRGNPFVSKIQNTGVSHFKEINTYSHKKAQHRSTQQHTCSYMPHILPGQDRGWQAPLAARPTAWSPKIQVVRSSSAGAPSPTLLPQSQEGASTLLYAQDRATGGGCTQLCSLAPQCRSSPAGEGCVGDGACQVPAHKPCRWT